MKLIFALLVIAAWITHVIASIKTAAWVLLVIGAILFPIGIVHGMGIWFGVL